MPWVKRESGENPERSRHCVREFAFISLGNWEGNADDDRSQETCLNYKIRFADLESYLYTAIALF